MNTRGIHIVVADAADQLGVSPQRVRALLASGELRGERVGDVWLIDPDSLANYRHVRQPRAGRALAPPTAWAALLTSFATDTTSELVKAFGIVGERRARLRALRARDVDDWRWLARRRATVNRYATRTTYLERLRGEPDLMPAGLSARRDIGIAAGAETFDAYVDATTAQRLVERYRLRPDNAGNVTLRSINLTASDQLAAIRQRQLPELVVAVDLYEDRDPRTAAMGSDLLRARLTKARSATR